MADAEDKKDQTEGKVAKEAEKAETASVLAEEEKAPETTEVKTEVKAEETKPKQKAEPKKAVPAKFKKLVEDIETMSVLELSELVKALEERFGVSAAAPVAMVAAHTGEAAAPAEEEGKKELNIILKEAGAKKIEVIKAVREISGLGLAESKAIVDGAPKTVKENVAKEDAESAKKQLEEAGATVELE